MAQVKQEDAVVVLAKKTAKKKSGRVIHEHVGKLTTFKGYDLVEMGVPSQALPDASTTYRGNHSYTVYVGDSVTCLDKQCFIVSPHHLEKSGDFKWDCVFVNIWAICQPITEN